MTSGALPLRTSDAREPSNGSRRPKRSKFVTGKQAKNLFEALKFAEQMGLRLNVSIDILWSMFSRFTDDKTRIARCQERLSKWCKRNDFPLTWIWVREIGKTTKGYCFCSHRHSRFKRTNGFGTNGKISLHMAFKRLKGL